MTEAEQIAALIELNRAEHARVNALVMLGAGMNQTIGTLNNTIANLQAELHQTRSLVLKLCQHQIELREYLLAVQAGDTGNATPPPFNRIDNLFGGRN